MEKHARALWQKLAPQLVELRVLSALDLEALRLLCDAWHTWRELEKWANPPKCFMRTSSGYIQPHPAIALRQQAAATIQKLWRQFGLTPLTREAIDMDIGEADGDELDAFAAARGD